jgi:hypothetical protein
MAKNFYRQTDAELVASSLTFSTLISATPEAYGLTAAQATAYAALNTAYAAAYGTAIEPSTRTRSAVAAKDQARKSLVASAKQLATFIIDNLAVSNAQLIDLGLSPRTARVIGPVPGSPPGVAIKSVNGWIVQIRLSDSVTERRGKLPGTIGASVFSYVGEAPPADISAWKFEGSTGRVVLDVAFDNTLAPGTKVWLTAFWFNFRKESGPACDPVSTRLQGGGVSLLAA